jgi:putative transposase
MDSEVIPSKGKSKKPLKKFKTLKMRLFPNEEEIVKIQDSLTQYRWYYNASINIINTHYGSELTKNSKYSSISIRDLINKYEYSESIEDDKITREFKYNEEKKKPSVPAWWSTKPHSRLPRGAYNKFTSSLNSAISNYKNGNISHFNIKFRSKKNPTDYLNYEDKGYPSFINDIKSVYWFRNNKRKRTKISLKEINKTSSKRGFEIIYEKGTGKYFLHYPVECDWFPEEDKRNENQVALSQSGNRIIALDPGIRKFQVGYDPRGESIFFGEGAQERLINLLYRIDKSENTYFLWKKVKNLVDEMHWKTINYLIKNYDIILLPDFRISQMIKGYKLKKITKRLMVMYSFHRFKEKLQYKCGIYNKKLLIVDESYTSCTCGRCGHINKTGGKEEFNCSMCDLKMDRDVGGSRNILLKNITLR